MKPPLRVLVLCTGNSARSQMAEALLVAKGGSRVMAQSAGSHPAPRVHPLAIQALAEIGITWAARVPRGIDAVADQPWDLVLTVCDNARNACPVFPAGTVMAHWGQPDPAEVVGPPASREAAFRRARDVIEWRVDRLLELPFDTEDLAGLGESIRQIGSGGPGAWDAAQ